MYPEQHIKDCKIIEAAGVTKDWAFERGDIGYAEDHKAIFFNQLLLRGTHRFPIGGDAFTNHLVRWLDEKGYAVLPNLHNTQGGLQFGILGYDTESFEEKDEALEIGNTFTEALVESVVWVLNNMEKSNV